MTDNEVTGWQNKKILLAGAGFDKAKLITRPDDISAKRSANSPATTTYPIRLWSELVEGNFCTPE